MFKEDFTLQSYIDAITGEGRLDDLIKICDIYHRGFDDVDAAIDWALNFGEYLGKFRYGDDVWKFLTKNDKVVLFFIGSRKEVSDKINRAL